MSSKTNNFSLGNFLDLNLKLTKSLVIKSSIIPYQINTAVLKKHGIYTPEDKRDWKYYKNIAGEYHEVDTEIKIFVSTLDREEVLTKELLDNHTYLREELLTFGDLYKKLIKDYPGNETLIKGMLLPVDKDYAISAEDGVIMNYNDKLVEKNETNLIPELEEYCKKFLNRWNVKLYTVTDDLYCASVMLTLLTKLPSKIFNIRLDNVNTYRAHSFHKKEFFNSNRRLAEDVDVLNDKVKNWLYKNLNYLQTHTGKKENLKKIIDKILTPSGIGIGEVKLIEIDGDNRYENINDKNLSIRDLNKVEFESVPLNEYFIINNGKRLDYKTLLKEEISGEDIDSSIIGDAYEYFNERLAKEVKIPRKISEKTKILEIDKVETFNLNTIPDLQVLLDNWFYLTFNDMIDSKIKKEFIDSNTNYTYSLDSKDACLLIIKLLGKMVNLDNPVVGSYKSGLVLDSTITTDDIVRNTLDKEEMKKIVMELLGYRPLYKEKYSEIEDLENYLKGIVSYSNTLWSTISNANNFNISGTVKTMFMRTLREKDISIDENKTINTVLEERGINFYLDTGYNYFNSITDLVKLFTNIDIDKNEEIEKSLTKYMNIVKKLTSYTIHFIHERNSSSNLEVGYTNFQTLSLITPVVNYESAVFDELEKLYGNLDVLNDQSLDTVSGTSIKINANYQISQDLELIAYTTSKEIISVNPLRVTAVKTIMPHTEFNPELTIRGYEDNVMKIDVYPININVDVSKENLLAYYVVNELTTNNLNVTVTKTMQKLKDYSPELIVIDDQLLDTAKVDYTGIRVTEEVHDSLRLLFVNNTPIKDYGTARSLTFSVSVKQLNYADYTPELETLLSNSEDTMDVYKINNLSVAGNDLPNTNLLMYNNKELLDKLVITISKDDTK